MKPLVIYHANCAPTAHPILPRTSVMNLLTNQELSDYVGRLVKLVPSQSVPFDPTGTTMYRLSLNPSEAEVIVTPLDSRSIFKSSSGG